MKATGTGRSRLLPTLFIGPVVLVLLLGLATASAKQGDRMPTVGLNSEERKVIDVLLADWGKRFRSTNIEQAMERAGLPYSHKGRMRLARYLMSEPSVKEKMRWQPATYILTNDEKRLARYILRSWKENKEAPSSKELSKLLNVSKQKARDGVDVLLWLGFLNKKGRNDYALADDHRRFLQGLGFNFHEVVLESGERFNIH